MRGGPRLAFSQRQRAQIASVQHQQIERVEIRPLTAEHQPVEIRSAVRVQAADLSIEHRALAAHRVRHFLTKLRPGLERVAVAE